MKLHLFQFGLFIYFVGIIPPQNVFKMLPHIQEWKIKLQQSPIWVSCEHHCGCFILYILVVLDSDISHIHFDRTFVIIISAMQNLWFDTSPNITIIESDNPEVIIEQIYHEFSTACTLVTNMFFSIIFIMYTLRTD